MECRLVGLPVQSGTDRPGCLMGPDALRTAGLTETLRQLGHGVEDFGNIDLGIPTEPIRHSNKSIKNLGQTNRWAELIAPTAYQAAIEVDFPIFLGGDHSLSIGSVAGLAQAAFDKNQPQFVLWLDAHPDFHTLDTTQSGNLHGTPVAYFTGRSGFENAYPKLVQAIDPANICMMGIRSVDPDEKMMLIKSPIDVYDMRRIDESGVSEPLLAFLDRVKANNGRLHVSLDVDFLDPTIAPAVGTTVPGGATFREAHLIMELLHDSSLVTSLDIVELNPFLDERGKTAQLMVDLCASLLGRKVLDRPTRSFQ